MRYCNAFSNVKVTTKHYVSNLVTAELGVAVGRVTHAEGVGFLKGQQTFIGVARGLASCASHRLVLR